MESVPSPSVGVLLARLLWMFAGPVALLLLGYSQVVNHQGWWTTKSAAYLAVLAAVIAARWRDPQSSEGRPVSRAELQRYSAGAAAIGVAIWVAANLLGTHGGAI